MEAEAAKYIGALVTTSLAHCVTHRPLKVSSQTSSSASP